MQTFRGVLTALATPFKDQQVDEPSLKRLIKHQMDGHVQGLVVMGTTGESPTLSPKEKKQIFHQVQSEVAGQVPVIVGVGCNNTRATIERSKEAAKWGADGLLCVVPYYNKPPQRGLLHHFQQISQAVPETPLILYNVPSRTITSLSLDTIKTLAQCKNIVGIKEASGDMAFDRNLIQGVGDGFDVVSGDDGSFDFFMELGGQGIISVISNVFPSETVAVYQAYVKGDLHKGRLLFQSLKNVINILNFDTNPIPIKVALYLSGIFSTPDLRSPLYVPTEQKIQDVRKLIGNHLKNTSQSTSIVQRPVS